MSTFANPPLIDISGGPRERGLHYGEKAASRVKRSHEHYSEQLEKNKLGWDEVRRVLVRFEPTIMLAVAMQQPTPMSANLPQKILSAA